MNYWLIYNGVKLGPMSLEQVLAMHIAPDTPVWRTGLPAWVRASELPELNCPATPPQGYQTPGQQWGYQAPAYQPATQPARTLPPMPPTYLAWSIVVLLVCCLIPGIVALIASTRVEPRYNSGDYAGARRASNQALIWILVGVVLGLIAIPFQIVYFLIAG